MTETTETDTEPLSRYHAGMLTLLTKLAEVAHQAGRWDEDPPALWCIDHTPAGANGALTAWEMPLQDSLWYSGGAPVEVLGRLTEHLTPVMQQRRDDGLGARRRVDAIALIGEAWTLAYPADATDEDIEQALTFARVRGEADHPWGVEAKTVIAVGADGWRYNVIRHRGKTGEGPAFAEPPGPDGITGTYPDALEALLAAMRARP